MSERRISKVKRDADLTFDFADSSLSKVKREIRISGFTGRLSGDSVRTVIPIMLGG